jgi:hypothetical protein
VKKIPCGKFIQIINLNVLFVVVPTSILPNVKKALIIVLFILISSLLYSFAAFMTEQQWINWGGRFLAETYDPTIEPAIKKVEITLTPDHFIRLRKTYQQGKQEYFSFHLQRFASFNYLPGAANTDTLQLKALADDIIVQTYEDPQGDVDSMTTTLNIPVKKATAARLDSLKQALQFLKGKEL